MIRRHLVVKFKISLKFIKIIVEYFQLIRGSALRVLSSIRLPIISPILLQGIREASSDMSPYVRKTAAHAIPKLVETDSSTIEEVIEIISRLLGDKAPLVSGSAVLAFQRVCPERIDLIHKNYRKLCQLLIDVDEWGQLCFIQVKKNYEKLLIQQLYYSSTTILLWTPTKHFFGRDFIFD
jgi:AP-3 complex subunit beta